MHEPLAHIVSKALAEHLQIAHHTLYQVSTRHRPGRGNLPAVRVGTLREHGDLDIARVDCLTRVNVCLLSAFAETAARRFVRQLNLRGEVPTGRQLPARWQQSIASSAGSRN